MPAQFSVESEKKNKFHFESELFEEEDGNEERKGGTKQVTKSVR